MKRIFVFVVGLLAATALKAQDKIIVDPNASVRNLNGKHFEKIEVSNAIKLIVTQGEAESIAVSANEEQYKEDIVTEINGTTLKIYSKNNNLRFSGRRNRKLTVYVSFVKLNALEASGATDVVAVGDIEQPALKLEVSGASTVKAALKVAELKAELSGASKGLLTGTAESAKIECNGASDLSAYKLNIANASIEASGASDIKVSVTGDLRADASGASSIRYKGNGVASKIKTSGASSISKAE